MTVVKRQELDPASIHKANVDTCTICNHSCAFCSNTDPRSRRKTMSPDVFTRVMDNLTSHMDIRELGLSAKGEPLLNPDLATIVELAKNRFSIPYTYISTNGSLLTPERLSELLDAGLDSIKISLNAFTRDDYERVHGKDHFERVRDNLRALAKIKKDRSFKVLTSTVSEKTPEELEALLAGAIGREFAQSVDHVWAFRRLFMPGDEVAPVPEDTPYKPCRFLFQEIYVDATGELVPCCVDYFGELTGHSLLEKTLPEAVNASGMESLRRMHVSKTLPAEHICYKCLTYEDRFKRLHLYKVD